MSVFTLPSAVEGDILEQEVPLDQLSDIKAKSIVEWIADDRVRRSIIHQFLMTYIDNHGAGGLQYTANVRY